MFETMKITREGVKEKRPLIHCITNPISIHSCANAVLAVGASPIMAEHPAEAAQITANAGALVLNLGNITDVRMESMLISARTAQRSQVPVVLDAVGVSCSDLRREFAMGFLSKHPPTVIKGNYSEICALYHKGHSSAGVDADTALTVDKVSRAAAALARKYGTAVLASGAADIVTDGERLAKIKNGTPQLATVTGTGCMQGVLCGAYLSVSDGFTAAVTAAAVLGICGELSRTEKGSGTFMVNLLDHLSIITDETIREHLCMEVYDLEEI